MITVVTTSMAYLSHDKENLEKVRALWRYMKQKDRRTYMKVRYGIMGSAMNLPGPTGRRLSVKAYQLTRKIMKFN